ncbi:MAG: hypothetical protein ACE5OW_01665 [Candidatus Bathyarchaeia archaeon]
MEKASKPRFPGRFSKKALLDMARKGIFNRNPMLAASHELVCKACGCTQKITYLDRLKSGRFELGETRVVEVAVAAPTISGLLSTRERITPIIMRVRCERCGAEIPCSPVSLEYLLFTARKPQKLEYMYV